MSGLPEHDLDPDARAGRREQASPSADAALAGSGPFGGLGAGGPAWATGGAADRPAVLALARRSAPHLQRLAGNAAVAALLAGPASDRRPTRVGPTVRHAAEPDVGETTGAPPGQQPDATPLEEPGGVAPPPVTSSFTKVGPPSPSTYTVSGTLRQAANAVAARPEAGATITTPALDIAADGKWPTHVQVTVTQVVELPEWSDRPSATTNQKAEWDRFKTAITAHENGHVAIDKAEYAGAHRKIRAEPTRAKGEAEFDRIATAADKKNDDFDAANDHGRNAGTTINPNIDEVTKVP